MPSTAAPAPDVAANDHRVRVAKMRRERMVVRLLRAVMECYGSHIKTGPPTVEEVIAKANVSRATFYKYFNSVEEAIERRANELAEEMVYSLKDLVEPQMRHALQFTASVHLTILRSVLDPTWAAFVGSSDMRGADGMLSHGMLVNLEAAREAGDMSYASAAAAQTMALGAMRETIRSLSRTDRPDRGYVDEITTMILISLGNTREEAQRLVREATIFIRGAAPDRLSWWRDPWAPTAERERKAAA